MRTPRFQSCEAALVSSEELSLALVDALPALEPPEVDVAKSPGSAAASVCLGAGGGRRALVSSKNAPPRPSPHLRRRGPLHAKGGSQGARRARRRARRRADCKLSRAEDHPRVNKTLHLDAIDAPCHAGHVGRPRLLGLHPAPGRPRHRRRGDGDPARRRGTHLRLGARQPRRQALVLGHVWSRAYVKLSRCVLTHCAQVGPEPLLPLDPQATGH